MWDLAPVMSGFTGDNLLYFEQAAPAGNARQTAKIILLGNAELPGREQMSCGHSKRFHERVTTGSQPHLMAAGRSFTR